MLATQKMISLRRWVTLVSISRLCCRVSYQLKSQEVCGLPHIVVHIDWHGISLHQNAQYEAEATRMQKSGGEFLQKRGQIADFVLVVLK